MLMGYEYVCKALQKAANSTIKLAAKILFTEGDFQLLIASKEIL